MSQTPTPHNAVEDFFTFMGISGMLAMMVTIAMIAWVSLKMTVPDTVWTLVGAAWSYYFATNGKAVVVRQENIAKSIESERYDR